jgi:hypothetical protein
LTSIELPAGLTSMDDIAFHGCCAAPLTLIEMPGELR